MNTKSVSNILGYFLIIIVPVFIFLANFQYFATNYSFYKSLQYSSGVYETFTYKEDVEKNTQDIAGHLKGKNELDKDFFSPQAILHMQDVKILIIDSAIIFYSTSTLLFFSIAWLISKKQYQILAKSLLMSSLATLIAIGLLALGITNAFETLFTAFHKSLFANELWLFHQDDNLIKLFPPQFFVNFASRITLSIALTAIALSFISITALRRIKSKK